MRAAILDSNHLNRQEAPVARSRVVAGLILLAVVACQSSQTPEVGPPSNLETVRGMYAAFGQGDIPGVMAALDSSVRWLEAEGFIYADGNPYLGPEAVLSGVFQRIGADLDSFTVTPQVFVDGGQTIVVEGRYRGRFKATGKPIDSQYAHVFEFRDGKVVRFQQYTDTRQWAEATRP